MYGAIHASVSEATHSEQASFQLKTSSTASTSSPVDRMLARKLENIETATKVLQNTCITAQKENFEQELSQAVPLKSEPLSVWKMPPKIGAYQTKL